MVTGFAESPDAILLAGWERGKKLFVKVIAPVPNRGHFETNLARAHYLTYRSCFDEILLPHPLLPERYYKTRSDPINFMSAGLAARQNRGFRELHGNDSYLFIMVA